MAGPPCCAWGRWWPQGTPCGQPSPAFPALSRDSVTHHHGRVRRLPCPTNPAQPTGQSLPPPAEGKPLPPARPATMPWGAVVWPAPRLVAHPRGYLPWLSSGAPVRWLSLSELPMQAREDFSLSVGARRKIYSLLQGVTCCNCMGCDYFSYKLQLLVWMFSSVLRELGFPWSKKYWQHTFKLSVYFLPFLSVI